MNKIKKISIIAIILYMFFITSVFASTATISVSAARLRSEANTESNVLAKIYEGEKVEILEKNGDWYKVKYGNKVGYLKNNLIKEDINDKNLNNEKNETNSVMNDNVDSNSSKIVTNSQTNIRYQPSMLSNVIIQVEKGKELTTNLELGTWIQVTDGVVTGWMIKSKTSVVTDMSNVNDSQDLQDKDIEKVETKEESSEKNNLKENETEKVKDKVEKNNNEQKDNQSQNVTSNKKGKVNVETAKVRKTADKTAKVVGFLDYNDEITILAEEGEWYKFTEKNVEGYVHKTLITVLGDGSVSSRGTNEDRDSEKKENINSSTIESTDVQNEVVSSENNNVVENKGQDVVSIAKKYLGYKYVVGGKNPETGFDCSGFTRYVYLQFGYSLGSTAAGQNNLGKEVSRENLRPGDLILFYDEGKTKIGHTGIYISNGDFIHSANPQRGVVIDNINTNSYYNERYIVAKRIVE